MENNELIAAISESEIKEKMYTIRGTQVMLDSDLAEIYGYETKNFNRQVKNNIEKFPEDMMFQLTKEDIVSLSRCKNFTLNKQNGRGHNIKYYDRFVILDNKVLYHIGASLKDAGKKAFEISIIDDEGQLQAICRRTDC